MNKRIVPNFDKYPAFAGRPKTPDEWDTARRLYRQMGYDMLVAFGTPPDGASALADLMFDGPNARTMLEMGYDIAEKRAAEKPTGVQK